jgi:hypothetical protein
MPTPVEFANSLLQLPLIRALRNISVRLGLRFALRGGVLRNFLFSYSGETSTEADFFEYVDPFSDIDLVVEDFSEWPQLAQAIASSIPFAGFHRWEVTSTRVMKQASKSYTMIPADRLLLWFEGREKTFSNVFVDGLDIDVEEVVRRPALHIDFGGLERGREEVGIFDQVLDLLRFARYEAAFPQLKSDIDPADLLRRSEVQRRFGFRRPEQGRQVSVERRRLEMAVLDLIFTASDWNRASYLLGLIREELPPIWLEESRLLSSVFYRSALVPGSGVGAVIYKSGPQSTPQIRIFNDGRPPRPELQNTRSLIPWVRLSYSGHNPADCCNYSDFQSGVATVVWRNKGSSLGFSNLEGEFAAVAAVMPPRGEYTREASADEPPLVSVPAYLRRGTSVVVRVDHGYVGGLLNRNVSFYLGLVPTSTR